MYCTLTRAQSTGSPSLTTTSYATTSPNVNGSPKLGVMKLSTGGSLPTTMRAAAVAARPVASTTRKVGLNDPLRSYVTTGFGSVESTTPSASKSQLRVSASPSGSL